MIRKLIQNQIFWYLFSRYFTFGVQFFCSIFLAIRLGPYYLGIWSFIVLLVTILGSCNWGIGNALTILMIQNKDNKELCSDYALNAFCLVLGTFFLPVLLTVYERVFGIAFLSKYHIGNWIYVICLIVMLQYIGGFFVNLYRVKNRLWEIAIQQMLWPLLMLGVLFFASGKDLLVLLIICFTIAPAVALLIFMFGRQLDFHREWAFSLAKQIFTKGFFLFLYNIGFMLIMLVTKLLISWFYSVEEFGYFSFAFSLAQGIVLMLDSVIFLFFPKTISMLKGNDTETIIQALKTMRRNYLVPLNLLIFIFFAGSGLFFSFLPQYQESFRAFLLILLTLLMHSNSFGYSSYLLAQNEEKKFALIVFASLLLNIVLVYSVILLKSRFEYAVLGTLVTYTIYAVTVNCYASYLIGINWIKNFIPAIFHWRLLPGYISALALIPLSGYSWCLILPLILFILLNHKQLKEFFILSSRIVEGSKLTEI